MKTKPFYLVILFVLFGVIFVGCRKEIEPVIGSWTLESAIDAEGKPVDKETLEKAGIDLQVAFSEDNTCAFESPQFQQEINGTWAVTTTTSEEKSKAYSAKADDGSIAIQFYFMKDSNEKLYGDFYGMSVTLVRK